MELPSQSQYLFSEDQQKFTQQLQERKQCQNCQRYFNPLSIQKHQNICLKLKRQRKKFNSKKQRQNIIGNNNVVIQDIKIQKEDQQNKQKLTNISLLLQKSNISLLDNISETRSINSEKEDKENIIDDALAQQLQQQQLQQQQQNQSQIQHNDQLPALANKQSLSQDLSGYRSQWNDALVQQKKDRKQEQLHEQQQQQLEFSFFQNENQAQQQQQKQPKFQQELLSNYLLDQQHQSEVQEFQEQQQKEQAQQILKNIQSNRQENEQQSQINNQFSYNYDDLLKKFTKKHIKGFTNQEKAHYALKNYLNDYFFLSYHFKTNQKIQDLQKSFSRKQQYLQKQTMDQIFNKIFHMQLKSQQENIELLFLLYLIQNCGIQIFNQNLKQFVEIVCHAFEKGSIQVRDTTNLIFLEIYYQIGQVILPYIEEVNFSVFKRIKIRCPKFLKQKTQELKNGAIPNSEYYKSLSTYKSIDEMKQFGNNVFYHDNEGQKEVNQFWIKDAIIYQIIKSDHQFAKKIIADCFENFTLGYNNLIELWKALIEFINHNVSLVSQRAIEALMYYTENIGKIIDQNINYQQNTQATVLIKPLIDNIHVKYAQDAIFQLYNYNLLNLEQLAYDFQNNLEEIQNNEEKIQCIYKAINQIFSRAQFQFFAGLQFQLDIQCLALFDFVLKNLHSNLEIKVRQIQLLSYMVFVFQNGKGLQDVLKNQNQILNSVKVNLQKSIQKFKNLYIGKSRQEVVDYKIGIWKNNLSLFFK